jgi:hypothetical protein
MKIKITAVDYAPLDLDEQTPFEAELLKQIPGKARSDYWLAALEKPICWSKQGQVLEITHIVVAARWKGTEIGPTMKNMPVGIAYVTDCSVLDDSFLNFEKCAYVAIGTASQTA